jgi:hypothetical protein
MIERLAKAHPERTATLLAEGAGTVEHDSSAKPQPNIQAGLRELDEIDIQSQKQSPLFGLFDNEVVCQKTCYHPSCIKFLTARPKQWKQLYSNEHIRHNQLWLHRFERS